MISSISRNHRPSARLRPRPSSALPDVSATKPRSASTAAICCVVGGASTVRDTSHENVATVSFIGAVKSRVKFVHERKCVTSAIDSDANESCNRTHKSRVFVCARARFPKDAAPRIETQKRWFCTCASNNGSGLTGRYLQSEKLFMNRQNQHLLYFLDIINSSTKSVQT